MEGHADIPRGSSSNLPRREAFVFRKMRARVWNFFDADAADDTDKQLNIRAVAPSGRPFSGEALRTSPEGEAFVFRKMQAWRGEKTMMKMEVNRHEDEGR